MTIDWWTLGLQTVNVSVLVWLLGRFFWRPVAAMIEERRAAARKILADADARLAEASAAVAEVERTRAGLAGERDAILESAEKTAQQAADVRLRDAAAKAAALENAAKVAIAQERASAEKAWADRASRLAVEIAGRLASRLQGSAVRASFLEWLVAEIRALPEESRQVALRGGGRLTATSATALEPEEQRRCAERLGQAFGGALPIAFAIDPDLIAGLELHGPHLTVANSWRSDLARIRSELDDAGRS